MFITLVQLSQFSSWLGTRLLVTVPLLGDVFSNFKFILINFLLCRNLLVYCMTLVQLSQFSYWLGTRLMVTMVLHSDVFSNFRFVLINFMLRRNFLSLSLENVFFARVKTNLAGGILVRAECLRCPWLLA